MGWYRKAFLIVLTVVSGKLKSCGSQRSLNASPQSVDEELLLLFHSGSFRSCLSVGADADLQRHRHKCDREKSGFTSGSNRKRLRKLPNMRPKVFCATVTEWKPERIGRGVAIYARSCVQSPETLFMDIFLIFKCWNFSFFPFFLDPLESPTDDGERFSIVGRWLCTQRAGKSVTGLLNLLERDHRRWTFSAVIAEDLVNDWQQRLSWRTVWT